MSVRKRVGYVLRDDGWWYSPCGRYRTIKLRGGKAWDLWHLNGLWRVVARRESMNACVALAKSKGPRWVR